MIRRKGTTRRTITSVTTRSGRRPRIIRMFQGISLLPFQLLIKTTHFGSVMAASSCATIPPMLTPSKPCGRLRSIL